MAKSRTLKRQRVRYPALGAIAVNVSRSYVGLTNDAGPSVAKDATVMTTVSTKGQVILPKAVRERRKWGAGTRLVVEETADASY